MRFSLFAVSLFAIGIVGTGCTLRSDPPEYIPEFKESPYWGNPQSVGTANNDLEQIPREPISFDSLMSQYEIVGRLGKPLGEFSTIQGTWRVDDDFKGDLSEFHVAIVDGKTLTDPIVYDLHDVEFRVRTNTGRMIQPADGEVWEVRAQEMIRNYGNAPNAHLERGFQGQQGMISWRTSAVLHTLQQPRVVYRPQVELGP
jgi:hypothetical protein